MNKEIKFRGRRIDNGEFVYGYLIGKDVIVGEIVEWDSEYFNTEFWYKVYPETVGQYTGLKDKNGKDIFEGDVFRTSLGHVAVVEWDDENGRFLAFTATRRIMYVGREPAVEIIGNIFENPELLEVNHDRSDQ